ncbi:hypothetical protein ACLOJK_014432 [Asimina triloba]
MGGPLPCRRRLVGSCRRHLLSARRPPNSAYSSGCSSSTATVVNCHRRQGRRTSSAALATVLQQLPVRCLAQSKSAGSSCPRPPPRSRPPLRLCLLTGVGEEAPHHAAPSIARIYCHGGGWVEVAPPRCCEISLMGKTPVAPP